MTLKVLVIGDVLGQFSKLLKQLTDLNDKKGPFDAAFCVGEFFKSDPMKDEDFLPVRLGQVRIPFPVYALVGRLSFSGDTSESIEIVPNLTQLARAGHTQVKGLTIAHLGVDASDTEAGMLGQLSGEKQDGSGLREPVVDLLLTSHWPTGIETGLEDVGALVPRIPEDASRHARSVAAKLHPRYHVCSKKEYSSFVRLPYVNASRICTRFIALSEYGNTRKQKFIHALQLVPASEMGPRTLTAKPENATASPYNSLLGRYGGGDGERDAKRQRRVTEDDKKFGYTRPSGCWFCLSSPNIEKHLIVGVGAKSYLALAKGGVTKEHLLVAPIMHFPSGGVVTSKVWEEISLYLASLERYFKSKGKGLVVFERNIPTRGFLHMHLQIVPISMALLAAAEEVFRREGKQAGVSFHRVKSGGDAGLAETLGIDPYFYVRLVGAETRPRELLAKVPLGVKLPLQFGRICLAAILGDPSVEDWKQCALPNEAEAAITDGIREEFQQFDQVAGSVQ